MEHWTHLKERLIRQTLEKAACHSAVTATGLPADRLLAAPKPTNSYFRHLTWTGPCLLGYQIKTQGSAQVCCSFWSHSSWARETGFIKEHGWHGVKKRFPSEGVCHNQKTGGGWTDKTKGVYYKPESSSGEEWISDKSQLKNRKHNMLFKNSYIQ